MAENVENEKGPERMHGAGSPAFSITYGPSTHTQPFQFTFVLSSPSSPISILFFHLHLPPFSYPNPCQI